MENAEQVCDGKYWYCQYPEALETTTVRGVVKKTKRHSGALRKIVGYQYSSWRGNDSMYAGQPLTDSSMDWKDVKPRDGQEGARNRTSTWGH